MSDDFVDIGDTIGRRGWDFYRRVLVLYNDALGIDVLNHPRGHGNYQKGDNVPFKNRYLDTSLTLVAGEDFSTQDYNLVSLPALRRMINAAHRIEFRNIPTPEEALADYVPVEAVIAPLRRRGIPKLEVDDRNALKMLESLFTKDTDGKSLADSRKPLAMSADSPLHIMPVRQDGFFDFIPKRLTAQERNAKRKPFILERSKSLYVRKEHVQELHQKLAAVYGIVLPRPLSEDDLKELETVKDKYAGLRREKGDERRAVRLKTLLKKAHFEPAATTHMHDRILTLLRTHSHDSEIRYNIPISRSCFYVGNNSEVHVWEDSLSQVLKAFTRDPILPSDFAPSDWYSDRNRIMTDGKEGNAR